VPYCPPEDKTVMRMLRLSSIQEFSLLKLNSWGIRDPTDLSAEEALDGDESLDLILAPGLAFDLNGNRLGHGRGYYDRYLITAVEKSKSLKKDAPFRP